MIASAKVLVKSLTDLMASSFAGIAISTSSGSQFVSTKAIIGILSSFASLTAIDSFFVSKTRRHEGTFFISLIPDRSFKSFSFFLVISSFSFLESFSQSPSTSIASISLSLSVLFLIVLKLVRVPPSHLSQT